MGRRVGAGHIVRGHTTQTALNEQHRMSTRLLPLKSLREMEVLGIKVLFNFCVPRRQPHFKTKWEKAISSRITKKERDKERKSTKTCWRNNLRGLQADAEVLHELNFYASVHYICFY